MNAIFKNLKVGQKIGLGYALALSIVCGGMATGMAIGYTLSSRANQNADYAASKIHTLTQFQNVLVSIQINRATLLSAEASSQRKAQALEEISMLSKEALKHWNTIEDLVEEIEAYPRLHIHRKLPTFYRKHKAHFPSALNSMKECASQNLSDISSQCAALLIESAQPESPQTEGSLTASSQTASSQTEDPQTTALSSRTSEDLSALITDLRPLLLAANQIYREAQDNARSAILLSNLVEAASLLISGIVSILLALAVSRSITKPLESVAGTAQKIIETETFDDYIAVTAKDEVGALADTINKLIQWVRQHTQRLVETVQELEEAQVQLIQTEKMSSLGQMVAGIAHEINNPIGFIKGNIEPLQEYFHDMRSLLSLYEEEYPHPSQLITDKKEEIELDFLLKDTDKLLASMNMGTQRVKDIVVSLRNYSRLDEATIKEVNIHEGIDSTLLILNHRIKQGVEIIQHYDDLPLVRCSPAQLNQVFTNIVANALDAMFDAQSDPKQLVITTRVLDTQQVQISFQDSGPGMSEAIKSRMFDPFFTTKDVGKGTGLGMGICLKIVQQHQGTIEFDSEVGKGTTCIITLPIAYSTEECTDSAQIDSAHVDSAHIESTQRISLKSR